MKINTCCFLLLAVAVNSSAVQLKILSSTKAENATLVCTAGTVVDLTYEFQSKDSTTAHTIAECLVIAKECFLYSNTKNIEKFHVRYINHGGILTIVSANKAVCGTYTCIATHDPAQKASVDIAFETCDLKQNKSVEIEFETDDRLLNASAEIEFTTHDSSPKANVEIPAVNPSDEKVTIAPSVIAITVVIPVIVAVTVVIFVIGWQRGWISKSKCSSPIKKVRARKIKKDDDEAISIEKDDTDATTSRSVRHQYSGPDGTDVENPSTALIGTYADLRHGNGGSDTASSEYKDTLEHLDEDVPPTVSREPSTSEDSGGVMYDAPIENDVDHPCSYPTHGKGSDKDREDSNVPPSVALEPSTRMVSSAERAEVDTFVEKNS